MKWRAMFISGLRMIAIVVLGLVFWGEGTGLGAEVIKGKVASAQGDGIELDVGSAEGVGLGDEGRVYYTIMIDGKETSIFVGKFKVTGVLDRSARGQIVDRTGEIKVGYGVEVAVRVGELAVSSDPSGAAVYLDRKEVGKTPLALSKVRLGRHQIRVQREGQENWEREVDIEGDRKVEVYAQLKSVEGGLEIRSEPNEAKVWVNGREMGLTPLVMSAKAGQYLVRVFREGYEVYEEWVQIEGGGQKDVRVSLKKILGDLTIQADPSNAIIYLDGKAVGTGTYQGKGLTPKVYRVRVVKEGHEDWERDVLVEEGKKVEIISRLGKKEKEVTVPSPAPRPKEKPTGSMVSQKPPGEIDWAKKVWEAPAWKVGDKWTYKSATGAAWGGEVVNIEGDWVIAKFSWQNDLSAFNRKTMNLDHLITTEGKKIEGSVSFLQKLLDFPLQVGKKWKNEAPKNTFNSFEVEVVERVSLPAGAFMAYRILYKQDKYEYNRLGHGVFKVGEGWLRYWYSPEVKFWLKMEREKSKFWEDQKRYQEFELISYRLK